MQGAAQHDDARCLPCPAFRNTPHSTHLGVLEQLVQHKARVGPLQRAGWHRCCCVDGVQGGARLGFDLHTQAGPQRRPTGGQLTCESVRV
jgi:hypothetical protein